MNSGAGPADVQLLPLVDRKHTAFWIRTSWTHGNGVSHRAWSQPVRCLQGRGCWCGCWCWLWVMMAGGWMVGMKSWYESTTFSWLRTRWRLAASSSSVGWTGGWYSAVAACWAAFGTYSESAQTNKALVPRHACTNPPLPPAIQLCVWSASCAKLLGAASAPPPPPSLEKTPYLPTKPICANCSEETAAVCEH